jgi:hypothetical protein
LKSHFLLSKFKNLYLLYIPQLMKVQYTQSEYNLGLGQCPHLKRTTGHENAAEAGWSEFLPSSNAQDNDSAVGSGSTVRGEEGREGGVSEVRCYKLLLVHPSGTHLEVETGVRAGNACSKIDDDLKDTEQASAEVATVPETAEWSSDDGKRPSELLRYFVWLIWATWRRRAHTPEDTKPYGAAWVRLADGTSACLYMKRPPAMADLGTSRHSFPDRNQAASSGTDADSNWVTAADDPQTNLQYTGAHNEAWSLFSRVNFYLAKETQNPEKTETSPHPNSYWCRTAGVTVARPLCVLSKGGATRARQDFPVRSALTAKWLGVTMPSTDPDPGTSSIAADSFE